MNDSHELKEFTIKDLGIYTSMFSLFLLSIFLVILFIIIFPIFVILNRANRRRDEKVRLTKNI